MDRARPVRNRRNSRKTWPNDILHRPVKRLFTPEIKRMLKDWLVRRRENPYPTRDEKKALAVETGLTYTQICNWFANWRRKLKNSGKQKARKNWGNLIKNYNTSAKGNVEQFSICSSDSIWEEENQHMLNNIDDDDNLSFNFDEDSSGGSTLNIYEPPSPSKTIKKRKRVMRKKKFTLKKKINESPTYDKYFETNAFNHQQRPYIDFTPMIDSTTLKQDKNQKRNSTTSKFKNHIIEKYFRGLDGTNLPPPFNIQPDINNNNPHTSQLSAEINLTGPQLSKWLSSAANFIPSRENYIEWCAERNNKITENKLQGMSDAELLHQQEEIEAAEALTNLAINFRNKFST